AGAGTVAVGGVAMTAAAALAAVAGAAAAVVSAFQTIGDIGRHGLGGGADYGSWRSGVGTFVANRSADVVRATKGSGLEWLPAWQALNTVSGGMVESEGLIKQQQERHARRLELEGGLAEKISAYGSAKTYRNLDAARNSLNEF